MSEEPEVPSDEGVSPEAVATPTRVDNLAEKMFAALEPVIENEEAIDVVSALNFVRSRYERVLNEQIDAAQATP